MAFRHLEEVQEFIDTYPGKNAAEQVENYGKRAKEAMTKQLETQLIKPVEKLESAPYSVGGNQFSVFGKNATFIESGGSTVMNKESLKIIAKEADSRPLEEREALVDYFKTLSREELESIKSESETAEKAWEDKYSLVIRKN